MCRNRASIIPVKLPVREIPWPILRKIRIFLRVGPLWHDPAESPTIFFVLYLLLPLLTRQQYIPFSGRRPQSSDGLPSGPWRIFESGTFRLKRHDLTYLTILTLRRKFIQNVYKMSTVLINMHRPHYGRVRGRELRLCDACQSHRPKYVDLAELFAFIESRLTRAKHVQI